MTAGRPLKFKSPEELQEKIDEFFKDRADDDVTLTGLAVHLEIDHVLLIRYVDQYPEFSKVIKKARARIASICEKRGNRRGNAFDIFMLKNYGYTDKQDIDLNISGQIDIKSAFDGIE